MVSNIPSQQNYAAGMPNTAQKEQAPQEKFKTFTPDKGDEVSFKGKGLSTGAKIGIAVGLGATIAGGIYLVKSGKGKQAIEAVKKFFNKNGNAAKDQIKEFTDDAGNVVKNVKLARGKAILENGEGFTGVMKTVTKTGKNVELKYSQGLIESSTIDGNVFKKYRHYLNPVINESATRIYQFDKYNTLEQAMLHSKYGNNFTTKVIKGEGLELISSENYKDLNYVLCAYKPKGVVVKEQYYTKPVGYFEDKLRTTKYKLKEEVIVDGLNKKVVKSNYQNNATKEYSLKGIRDELHILLPIYSIFG